MLKKPRAVRSISVALTMCLRVDARGNELRNIAYIVQDREPVDFSSVDFDTISRVATSPSRVIKKMTWFSLKNINYAQSFHYVVVAALSSLMRN